LPDVERELKDRIQAGRRNPLDLQIARVKTVPWDEPTARRVDVIGQPYPRIECVIGIDQPAPGRHFAGRINAGANVMPEFSERLAARKEPGDAHDGDRFFRRRG
jgi:hypothetical protein